MQTNEQSKVYVCPHCKDGNECVGVTRNETHYYSIIVETGQWKDKGQDAKSCKYFCLSCEKEINFQEQ